MGVCGGVVTGIEITNQSETAGLGANCTSDEFKSKFSFEKGIQYPSSDSLPMYFKAERHRRMPKGRLRRCLVRR